jgi:hypothetical protein
LVISAFGLGALLEHWLITAGSWTVRKLMKDPLTPIADLEVVMKKERGKWFQSTVMTLCNRSSTCNLQLFFISMILQFKGLSRNGSDFTAGMGLTLTRSTYTRHERTFMVKLGIELK